MLDEANLTGADLRYATFKSAYLRHATLDSVLLGGTVFADTHLDEAQGLELCRHKGPTDIDHRTLANNPHLPLAFLQGCGLSDWEIESVRLYNPDLTPSEIADIQDRIFQLRAGKSLQLYSCFISYASVDEPFARRLHDDLQDAGVRCWFAPEKMKGGQKIHDQITEAIRLHDKLLLILSEHSMKSPWVAEEIKRARRREAREGRQMLFPLGLVDYDWLKAWELFDADTVTDLAAEVRAYYIPDFSHWRDDTADYRASFERLVRDLQAGA